MRHLCKKKQTVEFRQGGETLADLPEQYDLLAATPVFSGWRSVATTAVGLSAEGATRGKRFFAVFSCKIWLSFYLRKSRLISETTCCI